MDVNEDRKARHTQQRREQILATAKRVFARTGYRRTSIDDIVNELGVGKGTAYRYFENKRALFLAVFEAGMKQLHEAIHSKVDVVEDPGERIKSAVRTFLEFFDSDRELIEIMMQVRSEFRDYYMAYYRQTYSEYIVNIQATLRRGMEINQFRALDVEKTADAMSDILSGTLQSFYTKQEPGLLIDKADAIAALVLNGVRRKTQDKLPCEGDKLND
jgi:AcrR family transcriptional regulator